MRELVGAGRTLHSAHHTYRKARCVSVSRPVHKVGGAIGSRVVRRDAPLTSWCLPGSRWVALRVLHDRVVAGLGPVGVQWVTGIRRHRNCKSHTADSEAAFCESNEHNCACASKNDVRVVLASSVPVSQSGSMPFTHKPG